MTNLLSPFAKGAFAVACFAAAITNVAAQSWTQVTNDPVYKANMAIGHYTVATVKRYSTAVGEESKLAEAINSASNDALYIIPISGNITMTKAITISAAKNIVLRKCEGGIDKHWDYFNMTGWPNKNPATPDLYDNEKDFILKPAEATHNFITSGDFDVLFIMENVAMKGYGEGLDYYAEVAATRGGGFSIDNPNFTFAGNIYDCAWDVNNRATVNTAPLWDNAVLAKKVSTNSTNSTKGFIKVLGGVFYHNRATAAGVIHGPWNGTNENQIFVSGYSIFKGNYSGSYGGAISCYGGTLIDISGNVLFEDNAGQRGGAVESGSGDMNISGNVVIRNNRAYGVIQRMAMYPGRGGGLCLDSYSQTTSATLTISGNVIIEGNSATLGGGGISIGSESLSRPCYLVLNGATIRNNVATGEFREAAADKQMFLGGGGGIMADSPGNISIPKASNVSFSGNTAPYLALIDLANSTPWWSGGSWYGQIYGSTDYNTIYNKFRSNNSTGIGPPYDHLYNNYDYGSPNNLPSGDYSRFNIVVAPSGAGFIVDNNTYVDPLGKGEKWAHLNQATKYAFTAAANPGYVFKDWTYSSVPPLLASEWGSFFATGATAPSSFTSPTIDNISPKPVAVTLRASFVTAARLTGFTDVEFGVATDSDGAYPAQTHTYTIVNMGETPATNITVTLDERLVCQENQQTYVAADYLSAAFTPTIAAKATNNLDFSITLTGKTIGDMPLPEGTYKSKATMTYFDGAHQVSLTADVFVAVAYQGRALNVVTNIDFGTRYEGYNPAPDEQQVVVKNYGFVNSDIVSVTLAGGDAVQFVMTDLSNGLSVEHNGEVVVARIKPVLNIPGRAETYATAVNVTYRFIDTDKKPTLSTARGNVLFRVRNSARISFVGGENTHSFTARTGYNNSEIPLQQLNIVNTGDTAGFILSMTVTDVKKDGSPHTGDVFNVVAGTDSVVPAQGRNSAWSVSHAGSLAKGTYTARLSAEYATNNPNAGVDKKAVAMSVEKYLILNISDPNDLSTATVTISPPGPFVYTGSEISPGIKIHDIYGNEITTHFNIIYSNNINASDAAKITINGTGEEKDNLPYGQKEVYFTILQCPIHPAGVEFESKIYDGTVNAEVKKIVFDVDDNLTPPTDLSSLAIGSDYTFASASFNFAKASDHDGDLDRLVVVNYITLVETSPRAANYSLSLHKFEQKATIARRQLEVAPLGGTHGKDYDNNSNALPCVTFEGFSNAIAGDDVGTVITSALFDNADVGSDKNITIEFDNLSGLAATNYEKPKPATLTDGKIFATGVEWLSLNSKDTTIVDVKLGDPLSAEIAFSGKPSPAIKLKDLKTLSLKDFKDFRGITLSDHNNGTATISATAEAISAIGDCDLVLTIVAVNSGDPIRSDAADGDGPDHGNSHRDSIDITIHIIGYPDPPRNLAYTNGRLSWMPPLYNGGSPIDRYEVNLLNGSSWDDVGGSPVSDLYCDFPAAPNQLIRARDINKAGFPSKWVAIMADPKEDMPLPVACGDTITITWQSPTTYTVTGFAPLKDLTFNTDNDVLVISPSTPMCNDNAVIILDGNDIDGRDSLRVHLRDAANIEFLLMRNACAAFRLTGNNSVRSFSDELLGSVMTFAGNGSLSADTLKADSISLCGNARLCVKDIIADNLLSIGDASLAAVGKAAAKHLKQTGGFAVVDEAYSVEKQIISGGSFYSLSGKWPKSIVNEADQNVYPVYIPDELPGNVELRDKTFTSGSYTAFTLNVARHDYIKSCSYGGFPEKGLAAVVWLPANATAGEVTTASISSFNNRYFATKVAPRRDPHTGISNTNWLGLHAKLINVDTEHSQGDPLRTDKLSLTFSNTGNELWGNMTKSDISISPNTDATEKGMAFVDGISTSSGGRNYSVVLAATITTGEIFLGFNEGKTTGYVVENAPYLLDVNKGSNPNVTLYKFIDPANSLTPFPDADGNGYQDLPEYMKQSSVGLPYEMWTNSLIGAYVFDGQPTTLTGMNFNLTTEMVASGESNGVPAGLYELYVEKQIDPNVGLHDIIKVDATHYYIVEYNSTSHTFTGLSPYTGTPATDLERQVSQKPADVRGTLYLDALPVDYSDGSNYAVFDGNGDFPVWKSDKNAGTSFFALMPNVLDNESRISNGIHTVTIYFHDGGYAMGEFRRSVYVKPEFPDTVFTVARGAERKVVVNTIGSPVPTITQANAAGDNLPTNVAIDIDNTTGTITLTFPESALPATLPEYRVTFEASNGGAKPTRSTIVIQVVDVPQPPTGLRAIYTPGLTGDVTLVWDVPTGREATGNRPVLYHTAAISYDGIAWENLQRKPAGVTSAVFEAPSGGWGSGWFRVQTFNSVGGSQYALLSPAELQSGVTRVSIDGTIVYNGTAQTPTITVVHNGDTLSPSDRNDPHTGYIYSWYNNRNASMTPLNPDSARVSVAGIKHYTGSVVQRFNIVRESLTIPPPVVANSRLYDGTCNADFTAITDLANNPCNHDDKRISFNQGSAKAQFRTRHAERGKWINFTGFTLNGSMKDNYNFVAPDSIQADIEPFPITVIPSDTLSYVYGTVTGELKFTTDRPLFTGDPANPDHFTGKLSLDGSGSLSSACRVTAGQHDYNLGNLTITDGNSGNNYKLQTINSKLKVSPLVVQVLGITTLPKTYDGTEAVRIDSRGRLTGTLKCTDSGVGYGTSDDVTLIVPEYARANSRHAFPDQMVTLDGAASLEGADAANYALDAISYVRSNISPANIAVALGYTDNQNLGTVELPYGTKVYTDYTITNGRLYADDHFEGRPTITGDSSRFGHWAPGRHNIIGNPDRFYIVDGNNGRNYNLSISGNSFTIVFDPDGDYDGDGISNGDELKGGDNHPPTDTDPLNPDTDGDGHTDGREQEAGSDPNNPNDYPGSEPEGAIHIYVSDAEHLRGDASWSVTCPADNRALPDSVEITVKAPSGSLVEWRNRRIAERSQGVFTFMLCVSEARSYDETIAITPPSQGGATSPNAPAPAFDTRIMHVIIHRPFAFSDVVVDRFDNSLFVDRLRLRALGYPEIASYQWYRNGEKIAGATGRLYSLGRKASDIFNERDSYSVEMTFEGLTAPLNTCPAVPVLRYFTGSVKAWPNPLPQGQALRLSIDNSDTTTYRRLVNTPVQIFDLKGRLVKIQRITGHINEIQVNLPKGIYFVRVNGEAIKIEVE